MMHSTFIVPPICSNTGGDLPCNHIVSALELLEWHESKPARAFVYVDEEHGTVTNWMGKYLGTLQFGRSYRSNMGDYRVQVRVLGSNGRKYSGTYYRSAGNYAHIRAVR